MIVRLEIVNHLKKINFGNPTCGSLFELHYEMLHQNIKIYLMTIYNIMLEIYKWNDRKKAIYDMMLKKVYSDEKQFLTP